MNTYLLQKAERLRRLIQIWQSQLQDHVNISNFTNFFKFSVSRKKPIDFSANTNDDDDIPGEKPIFTIGDVFTAGIELLDVQENKTNKESPIVGKSKPVLNKDTFNYTQEVLETELVPVEEFETVEVDNLPKNTIVQWPTNPLPKNQAIVTKPCR